MTELTTLAVKSHDQPCKWDRSPVIRVTTRQLERQQEPFARMGWKPKATMHTHTRVPSRQNNMPCRQLLRGTSATPSVWVHNTTSCRCEQDQASLDREDEALAASIRTISAARRARRKQQLIDQPIVAVTSPPPRRPRVSRTASGKTLVSRLLSSLRQTPSVEIADLTNGCADLDVTKVAHYLFDREIPVNTPNHLGLTPLMATLKGRAGRARPKAHLAFVGFLLDCGADPNATFVSRDNGAATGGGNVLSIACTSSCSPAILRLLLNRGAAVDASVSNGKGKEGKVTAIHVATLAGNAEALEVLLGYGGGSANRPFDADQSVAFGHFLSEPTTREDNSDGKGTGLRSIRGHMKKRKLKHPVTPLHLAHGNEACIDVLLRHGADPMARDGYGRTPLHWASGFGRSEEVVRRLLDCPKTDVGVTSDDGVTTPLGCVVGVFESGMARGTHVEIVRLLVGRMSSWSGVSPDGSGEGKERNSLESERSAGNNLQKEKRRNRVEGLKKRLLQLEDYAHIFEEMFVFKNDTIAGKGWGAIREGDDYLADSHLRSDHPLAEVLQKY
ncbi:ankyrin repeat-containing domain protein [Podospora australis]|uniref:protein S-acyltransferase n=1 Tax=Podospora australis TaxID=1536484 RepID=A0AAN6WKT4_9PEZI|nr:ankyrin repeat-containing domain protein [Podospora australis]